MKLRLLLYILVFGLLCGCNDTRHWYKAGDGIMFYTSKRVNNAGLCKWSGRNFGGVAVGQGYLVCYDGSGNETSRSEQSAVWGSFDEVKDPNNLILGELCANEHCGFNVVVSGDEVYIGEYRHSKPDGKLKFYKGGALRYDGMWRNGKREGAGMVLSDHDTIYGTWDNDQLVDDVYITWGKGFYRGELKDGKPHGHGYMFSEGFSYTGDWVDGRREGYGEAVLPNGDEYAGEWNKDLFSGKGEYRSQEFVYEGEWAEGMMDGEGSIAYANGDVFEGSFRWNSFNGRGAYKFSDGTLYDGDFALGLFNGEGTLFLNNGNVYEGEFAYNGFGRYGTMYMVEDGDTVAVDYVDNSKEAPATVEEIEREVEKVKVDWSYDDVEPVVLVPDASGRIYQMGVEAAEQYRKKRESIHEFVSAGSDLAFLLTLPFPQIAPVVMPVVAAANVAELGMNVYSTAMESLSNGGEVDWLHTILQSVGNVFNAVLALLPFKFLSFDMDAPKNPNLCGYAVAEAGVGSAVAKGVESAVVRGMERNAARAAEKGAAGAVERSVERGVEKGAVRAVENGVEKGTARAVENSAAKETGAVVDKAVERASQKAAAASAEKPFVSEMGRFRRASDARLAPSVRSVKPMPPYRLKVAQSLEAKGERMSPRILQSAAVSKTVARPGMAAVENEYRRILDKGPIRMTSEQYEKLRSNPEYLRNYVKAMTGSKTLGEGFQEFFIRLGMHDKGMVRGIFENQKMKGIVFNAIRGDGGVHEWLMTKNAPVFLTDPALGENGPKMFLLLNKFVQNTKNVKFKAGGSHFLGGENSSAFHAGLSDIIASEKSGDIGRVAGKIRMHAKEFLTPDSYEDFMKIYRQFF